MLSQGEYEALVRSFLVELNHLWVHESEEPLRALPTFRQINDEYLPELRDPERDDVQVLRTAFAYVDELIAADWARVIKAGYTGHTLSQGRG